LIYKTSTCLRLNLFPAKEVDAWALCNKARRLSLSSNLGDKHARSITSRAAVIAVRLFKIFSVIVYFGLNGIKLLLQITTYFYLPKEKIKYAKNDKEKTINDVKVRIFPCEFLLPFHARNPAKNANIVKMLMPITSPNIVAKQRIGYACQFRIGNPILPTIFPHQIKILIAKAIQPKTSSLLFLFLFIDSLLFVFDIYASKYTNNMVRLSVKVGCPNWTPDELQERRNLR
jgi:hypothetical protein